MDITSQALHRPLAELFTRRFAAHEAAPAEFRFDRTPATFEDGDFTVAGRPGQPSGEVATERLAELVDRIPLMCSDGRSVELGPRRISELYRDQLVGPAVAWRATGGVLDCQARAAADEFDRLKADAMQRLEATRAASVLGPSWFHPVQTSPATWWNRADRQVWSTHQLDLRCGPMTNAPEPDTVSIGFEFCVVCVTRSWMSHALLDSMAWCIPGEKRGRWSANDGAGLPALPVGLVLIQRLRITAAATAPRAARLEPPARCGPFVVDAALGDGVIGRDGLQIVGWLLRDLASLPPHDGALRSGDSGAAQRDRPASPLAGPPPSAARRDRAAIPFVPRVDIAGCRAVMAHQPRAVVFVSAGWAGTSRQIERLVESVAREHRDAIALVELAFETIEGTRFVHELGLTAVPSFLVLRAGREVARIVGMAPEDLVRRVHVLRSGREPTARARTTPLWGVARVDRSSFPVTVRRRDTLVFASDPASATCRVLEPVVRAVSALCSPQFQTCELDLVADPELARQLGVHDPGTFVLYRDGDEAARAVRPAGSRDLLATLGLLRATRR